MVKSRIIIYSLIGTVLLFLGTGLASAAVFNIADGDVAGLKAAMTTAASNQESDVINLAANGTYTLTTVDNTTNGPNGLPVMGHERLVFGTDITIHGNGATVQRDTTDGIPLFRIFEIVGGNMVLQDLIIQRGAASFDGGGLETYSTGTLTLLNCTFRMNEADQGGCIRTHSPGTITLTNCVFENNQFATQGAAIANYGSTININGCTFSANEASSVGGAIYDEGPAMTITNSTFANNSAVHSGGGIYSETSTLTISQSTLNANSAADQGGAIAAFGDQVVLTDSTFSTNEADQGGAIRVVSNPVTISNCKFIGNGSSGAGGAIFNLGANGFASTLNIDHTTFNGNGVGTSVELVSADPNGSTVNGGAISNNGATATVTLTNCSITKTTGAVYGAGTVYGIGIYNDGGTVMATDTSIENSTTVVGHELEGNNYGTIVFEGGAVFNNGSGEVNLTRCTLGTNFLPIGAPASSEGGGVFNNGSGSINILNSTLAFNTANFGGGIWNNANGAINLLYSTGAFNSAGSAGGISNVSGPFSVRSSIVAFNSATGSDPDVSGNFTSGGFNLIGIDQNNGFNAATDKKGGPGASINPQFDVNSLADNGGPTKTVALLSNSPAINSGDNANAPARDQRNYIRQDAADIGAFEFHGKSPTELANISTRAFVQTGDNVMIGGFIIRGNGLKKVIIRARGPSLSSAGIANPLQNPTLELHSGSSTIATNDNWGDAANHQDISNSGFAPSNSLESAILMTLNPGPYTAIVSGVGGGTGTGLIEGFDLEHTAGSRFGDISTRAFVQTGNNVMIAGFIVAGPDSDSVIVRAIGPSLSNFGVANAMSDPTLELQDANGNVLASNDNWGDTQQAQIQATGFAPSNSLESAILQTLAPGNYTATVQGKNNTTGVAVVEVYGLN